MNIKINNSNSFSEAGTINHKKGAIVKIYLLWLIILQLDNLSFYSISIVKYISISIAIIIASYLLINNKIYLSRLINNKTLLIILSFIIINIVSMPFAYNAFLTFFELVRLINIYLSGILIYLFISDYDDIEIIRSSMIILFWGAVFCALTIITDYFSITGFTVLRDNIVISDRYYGIIGEPNFAAGKLGIILPFSIYLLSYNKENGNTFSLLRIISGIIVILGGILITGSRMGGVIVLVTIIMYFITSIMTNFNIKNILHKILLIFILGISITIYDSGLCGFNNRLTMSIERQWSFLENKNINDIINKDSSTQQRYELILIGLNIFYNNYLTGIGLGNFYEVMKKKTNFSRAMYSHNNFITTLCETGIIGFMIYIYLIIHIVINLYKYYIIERNKIIIYLGISFINILIMQLLLPESFNKVFWCLFIPISSLIDFKKNSIK